jgi:hypothetical protein
MRRLPPMPAALPQYIPRTSVQGLIACANPESEFVTARNIRHPVAPVVQTSPCSAVGMRSESQVQEAPLRPRKRHPVVRWCLRFELSCDAWWR